MELKLHNSTVANFTEDAVFEMQYIVMTELPVTLSGSVSSSDSRTV